MRFYSVWTHFDGTEEVEQEWVVLDIVFPVKVHFGEEMQHDQGSDHCSFHRDFAGRNTAPYIQAG